jgi:drug/metabolite transporter (DMT)-like permease
LTLVSVRLFLSSIILLAVIFLFKKREKIEKKDYWSFLLLTFFEPFCYFMGESFGIDLVSPTVASLIIAVIPVITPIFAFLFLREKITWLNLVGLILSFLGVAFLVMGDDAKNDAPPIGIALLLCAVAAAIGYGVMTKKLSSKYSSLTIITIQNVVGVFFFVPLFFIFDFKNLPLVMPSTEVITSVIMLTIFASTLAFLLYIPVIRELGVNRANVFTNLIPVITAGISYFLLNEMFTMNKFIGMFVILSGVMLAQVYKAFSKK